MDYSMIIGRLNLMPILYKAKNFSEGVYKDNFFNHNLNSLEQL